MISLPLRNTPCPARHHAPRITTSAQAATRPRPFPPTTADTDPLAVQTPHLCLCQRKKTWPTPPVPRPQNFAIRDLKLCSAAISTPLHFDYRKASGTRFMRDRASRARKVHRIIWLGEPREMVKVVILDSWGLKCKTQGGGVRDLRYQLLLRTSWVGFGKGDATHLSDKLDACAGTMIRSK